MAKYNEKGQEILDTTPVAVPLNFKKPLPIADLVRKMVVRELSQKAVEKGHESFEEADDFNVGDEPELRSKYELDDDQENAQFITEEPKNVMPKNMEGGTSKNEGKMSPNANNAGQQGSGPGNKDNIQRKRKTDPAGHSSGRTKVNDSEPGDDSGED